MPDNQEDNRPDLLQWKPDSAVPASWHVLLLKAALLREPSVAVASWKDFQQSYDFLRIDHGSSRLLPLVYHNLSRAGHEGREMPRLKGICRYYWAQGSSIMYHARRAAAALRGGNIPVVAVKGCGLVSTIYANPSLRPMGDIDFWVRPEDMADAVELLGSEGWHPEIPGWQLRAANSGALVLQGEDLPDIDLHMRIFNQADANARAWAHRREPGSQVPWQVLSVEDEIIFGCQHGMRWNPVAPVRWLADVAVMMQKYPMGSEELAGLAASSRISWSLAEVGETFRLLHREVGLDQVEEADRYFQKQSIPWSYRVGLWLRNRAGSDLPRYWQFWVRYRQLRAAGDVSVGKIDFIEYLRLYWGLESREEARRRVRHQNRMLLKRKLPLLHRLLYRVLKRDVPPPERNLD